MRELTPDTIHPPFARYAHGVEIPGDWRIIQTSGQLGIRTDGTIPEDAHAQAEVCFDNITEILASAGMALLNIAHITAYVTDRSYMTGYMAARDAFLSNVPRIPSSTLLIVSGFTRPEFKVEIEVTAASPQ